jgi:integrase
MARKPVYGLHKATNQARTTFNGKRVYLGQHGSSESHQKFDDILARWEAAKSGRTTPTVSKMTVGRLALLFLEHAAIEYCKHGKRTGEYDNFRQALRALTRLHHGCRVVDFGPKKLKLLQRALVEEGLSQSTINNRLRRIKQAFSWGVSEELIAVDIAQALRCVQGLRRGKTKAKAPQPKPPVSIEHVDAIKSHVTRPVWGLIQFALLTGCRPSEACVVRWSQIDTSGRVWIYQPGEHKTEHYNKSRIIAIGPKAQQLLNSFRELSRSDYVFDPQVGLDEFVRTAYGEHATARRVGERYTKDSLYTAIRNACDKAGVPRWSPGQLRKTRATEARRESGLEVAQGILGHSSKATTERHYAGLDMSIVEENTLKFG